MTETISLRRREKTSDQGCFISLIWFTSALVVLLLSTSYIGSMRCCVNVCHLLITLIIVMTNISMFFYGHETDLFSDQLFFSSAEKCLHSYLWRSVIDHVDQLLIGFLIFVIIDLLLWSNVLSVKVFFTFVSVKTLSVLTSLIMLISCLFIVHFGHFLIEMWSVWRSVCFYFSTVKFSVSVTVFLWHYNLVVKDELKFLLCINGIFCGDDSKMSALVFEEQTLK